MRNTTLLNELAIMPADLDHFQNELGHVIVKIPGEIKYLPSPLTDEVESRKNEQHRRELSLIVKRGNVRIRSKYCNGAGYLEINGAGGYYIQYIRDTQKPRLLTRSEFTVSFQLSDVHSVDTCTHTVVLK